MAAAAILKITILAISWPLLDIFALNLMRRLKTGSRSNIYRQNSHSPKVQDGCGRHFELSQTNKVELEYINGDNSAIFEPICSLLSLHQI